MIGRTHMSIGMLISFVMIPITGYLSLTHLGLCTLGSLFPDFDTTRSTVAHMGVRISKNLKIKPFLLFSMIGSIVFGHRSQTHTLGFTFVMSLVVFIILWYFSVPNPHLGALAFGIGYLSHILSDGMTLAGVPLLWPIKPLEQKWHIFPKGYRVRTGSLVDVFLGLAFMLLFAIGLELLLINGLIDI